MSEPAAHGFLIDPDTLPLEGWDDSGAGPLTWRTLVSADRTPSRDLTAGVCQFRPGDGELRLHRHAQAEVYHFLAGTGRVHIDGTEHEVRAGSTLFVPGGAWHGTVNTGPDELRLFYCFPCDSFAEVHYEFADGETWQAPPV